MPNYSEQLLQKITQVPLTPEAKDRAESEIERLKFLESSPQLFLEADRQRAYIELLLSLPWESRSSDILDLNRIQAVLDSHHFGLASVKQKILEYLSVFILKQRKGEKISANALFFLGLVGSGKTSLAFSIAEALGREIIRIPFGGLSGAWQLRGQSRSRGDSEPGLIIKGLKTVGVKNPVILLDELDRVAPESKSEVMGVLVELLDPEQNNKFFDHFLDMPFDLSDVLFIATANNSTNIVTAVLDRLEVIEMPFYSDEQKVAIGKDFLLSSSLQQAGLEKTAVQVEETIWPLIVRPLGYDGGIRSLKRTIDGMVRKVAKEVIEGKSGQVIINSSNIDQYLEKK